MNSEETQITDIKTETNEETKTEIKEETPDDNSKDVVNDDKHAIEVETQNIQMCIRDGCINQAVNNPEWEQEFCSNDCVIIHCRNVFMAWVKANEVLNQ
ncbi:hypothetical protein PGB90_008046 [Kerria lacca]